MTSRVTGEPFRPLATYETKPKQMDLPPVPAGWRVYTKMDPATSNSLVEDIVYYVPPDRIRKTFLRDGLWVIGEVAIKFTEAPPLGYRETPYVYFDQKYGIPILGRLFEEPNSIR